MTNSTKIKPLKNTDILWCIYWPEGDAIISTISSLRKEAIGRWIGKFSHYHERSEWRYWKCRGLRVGKCKVVPL